MAPTPKHIIIAICAPFVCGLWAACAPVPLREDTSDYQRKIALLESRLVDNSSDAEALRDLGVIYFQIKQYSQADSILKRSYEADPKDAKTVFYYGMTLEYENNPQGALAAYINYTDFPPLSSYRPLIEGRYRAVTNEIIRQQFRSLLVNEQELANKKISPGTVAVFPLTFQGTDDRYAPLGKGLSEMLISDLGKVKKLALVERVRIEALLEELRFSQTNMVDQSSAPRLGKLLGAGRIVTGLYSISSEKKLTLNVAALDVVKNQYPGAASRTDELDQLFQLEKEFALDLIKKMGITLTAPEREAIRRFPTRNLEAFLLYSTGLEKEDAHDFRAAGVYFNQASSVDPGFVEAKNKSVAMEALAVAGGDRGQALSAAQKVEAPITPDTPVARGDLMTDRLQKLGNGIGSNFYPGQEDRKPAQGAAAAGVLGGQLPAPPPPPR